MKVDKAVYNNESKTLSKEKLHGEFIAMQVETDKKAYNIVILMYKVQSHTSLHHVKHLHEPNSFMTSYTNHIELVC